MQDATLKKTFDRSLISFEREFSVRYWCNSLGCTQGQLRAAVRSVGCDAEAVRLFLKKK